MTYIVAFVKFSDGSKDYPVDCFRTDLKIGDEVIVRRSDGKLLNTMVTQVHFLNWDCKSRVVCKTSESSIDQKGAIVLPKGPLLVVGLATIDAFIARLREIGWASLKPKHKMYRAVLANTNDTQVSLIYIRRNGLDIQLLPLIKDEPIPALASYQDSFSSGRVVRHALSHTSFNLYDGVIRFSDSFLGNEENYDRYFIFVGTADKRTDELKAESESRVRNRKQNDMGDIYYASSDGDGGPAYLSDGMWLTSGGEMHDWGR